MPGTVPRTCYPPVASGTLPGGCPGHGHGTSECACARHAWAGCPRHGPRKSQEESPQHVQETARPGRRIDMRVPQVTERMKEAPAHALRAVFAGIGQVLLVADRLRSRAADGANRPPAATPEPDAAHGAAVPEARTSAASTAASADSVAAAAAAAAATTAPAAAAATTAPAAAAAPAARAATAAATPGPAAAPAVDDLPVPNYDELSVPSLRARMRSLSPAELRELVAYESTHAARTAVLAMFERRLAKIDGGEA